MVSSWSPSQQEKPPTLTRRSLAQSVERSFEVSSSNSPSRALRNLSLADPAARIPPVVLFYILTCLVIGLCINYQDPSLFTAYDDSDVSASPITTVFKQAGFKAAVHVVNAVLLTAVLSATNSCFYASSRMLLALARQGDAPKVFSWVTPSGVPVPALLCVTLTSPLVLKKKLTFI